MAYEYKLRKEDFIPIVGLIKHHKRCVSEMYRNKLVGNDEYVAQVWARDCLLGLYNSAIFTGALMGIAKGIESIISK